MANVNLIPLWFHAFALQMALIVALPISWVIIIFFNAHPALIWLNGIGGVYLVSASFVNPGKRWQAHD